MTHYLGDVEVNDRQVVGCDHCGADTDERDCYRVIKAGVQMRGFTLTSGTRLYLCAACYGQFARDVQ